MVEAWLFTDQGVIVYPDGSSTGTVRQLEDFFAEIPQKELDKAILFDCKNLYKRFPELQEVDPAKIFDVQLAAYVQNPANNFADVPEALAKLVPEFTVNAEQDAARGLLLLYEKLADIAEHKVYKELELPLAKVLANMESRGIFTDKAALEKFGSILKTQIKESENNIYTLAQKEFNINSTKQLSELLFEELKLPPPGKKTKNGYSTDAETLEKLRDAHPIIDGILKYRKMSKVYSTYVEGLLKYIDSANKVHTTFNMTATATGRLSSTEPNLQNIPVANEPGGEIRKYLLPGDGRVFIDADYSQIELRILAHMAHDPVMIEAFQCNQDIHSITAQQIFGIKADEITPELRRRAKAVNFGIVYGISPFTLAADLKISRDEAKEYIDKYFEKYSAIKSYLDNTIKSARKLGYVETLFHRRRYLPELHSKVFAVRSFGERVALNMPIQGTAADLIKLAMIKVDSELKKTGTQAELLLQIHDELLLSATGKDAEKAAEILQRVMQNIYPLAVPLDVSLHIGKNYYDVK